jgi:hypothetical protein
MKGVGGYIMIDHRASPGLPEDVARLAGYDPKLCGEGKVFESKTMTCGHCGGSVVPNVARIRPRASCLACDNREGRYICDGCDFLRSQPGYVHKPMVQVIDEVKERAITHMGTPLKLLTP